MARPPIAALTAAAAEAKDPFFVPSLSIGIGGVDPLGLREINFDLMDRVLPGLNNVARHVRPFVVATWAWHRAAQVARQQGLDRVPEEEILDFVDRVDVIYVWSQFLRDPNADLPGRQVIAPIIRADSWVFDGPDWSARRKTRRLSTALMAPINYGPALKSLGWIQQHQHYPNVFLPSAAAAPAITSFEEKIAGFIEAPALSSFGAIEIGTADVASWANAWALDEPSEIEQHVMRQMLMGSGAPIARRKGCTLMLAAVHAIEAEEHDVEKVRAAMAGAPSGFIAPEELSDAQTGWRKVQVRQLFRLALEALFYWASSQLADGNRTTDFLVRQFVKEYVEGGARSAAIEWIENHDGEKNGPTELQDAIGAALRDPAGTNLPREIVDALRLCLGESQDEPDPIQRPDRLPLSRAKQDAEAWAATGSTHDFLRNVFENWVFAQHVYWSVGRGLADARARGKTILRLKVVLEENGWALAPGVDAASKPSPSGDRLRTALTLVGECGLLNRDESASLLG